MPPYRKFCKCLFLNVRSFYAGRFSSRKYKLRSSLSPPHPPGDRPTDILGDVLSRWTLLFEVGGGWGVPRFWDRVSGQVTSSPLLTAPRAPASPTHLSAPLPLPFLHAKRRLCQLVGGWLGGGGGGAAAQERVRSHLLFYRQPAFSPRDLIITHPVGRIAHSKQ